MAEQQTYEMKQLEAYHIAEADNFSQHPDVYWNRANLAPVKHANAKKDKLTVIEGIGPKIALLLNAEGIESFADLAQAKVGTLSKILKAAGPRFSFHKPNSWPKQAKLARDGKMAALRRDVVKPHNLQLDKRYEQRSQLFA